MFYAEITGNQITGKGICPDTAELGNDKIQIAEDIHNQLIRLPATFEMVGGQITNIVCARIDIEQLRNAVIQTMSAECEKRIYAGFDSDCLGTVKHFTCDLKDQANITGRFTLVQAKEGIEIVCQLQNRQPTALEQTTLDKPLTYKADGELECYPWTHDQIKKLGLDMDTHITSHQDRFYALRMWANDPVRTQQELEGWRWDMQLPT